MPFCVDVNNVPQDCSAASDSGGSSCYDDTGTEVSCSEVGGYASALDTSLVPGITSGPGAANASLTGAASAAAANKPGPSFWSTFATVIPAIGTAVAAGTSIAPKTVVKSNAAGLAIPSSAGTLLLVGALAVAGIFLYTASKRK